jgi:DNA-binding FadR family transcriptional regulator
MRSADAVIAAALRASFLLSAPVDPDDRDTVLSWHRRIVEAIAEGNPTAAHEAMTAVIFNGMRRHGARAVDPTLHDPAAPTDGDDKDRK